MANNSSKLLIHESPLQVSPTLAKLIGLEEALVLQQIQYWLSGRSGKERDGRRWVYNTYDDWQEQFPFMSKQSIGRLFRRLEKDGLIISAKFNSSPWDHTKWYSIDYDILNDLICNDESTSNDTSNSANLENSEGVNLEKSDSVQNDTNSVYPPILSPYLTKDYNREYEQKNFTKESNLASPKQKKINSQNLGVTEDARQSGNTKLAGNPTENTERHFEPPKPPTPGEQPRPGESPREFRDRRVEQSKRWIAYNAGRDYKERAEGLPNLPGG